MEVFCSPLTTREVYREIVSNLKDLTQKSLYSNYDSKFLDDENRMQVLGRGANVIQKTQQSLRTS